MVYMIDQADHVSSQLEKFANGYAHHVVGQYANLEFWLAEATHALETIEGYGRRFERMSEAQSRWVRDHGTLVGSYCPQCGGGCELEDRMQKPTPPTVYPAAERTQATRRLRDAVYHFLRRCYRLHLLDEDGFRARCEREGTSVDLADLPRP